MQRSFSYTLLITWFLLLGSCGSENVPVRIERLNLVVSDSVMPVDSQMILAYLPYKEILERDMRRVISVARDVMIKNRPESNLTNFLGDLLLEEGRLEVKNLGRDFSPDISYFNYGGIRTSLPRGEITVGKIYELMPFENEMVFVQIDGRQVQNFLNGIAAKGGDSLGGVRFKIHNDKAGKILVDGKPLDPDRTYWIVTNDYVASGGDDMEMFAKRSDFLSSNLKIRDVIIRHMEKKHERGEVLTASKDGRIANE